MTRTKLNGWLKVMAIGAMMLLAALGAAIGYGKIAERVDTNDKRITTIEEKLEPRVRTIEQTVTRIETTQQIILHEVQKDE